ncbi:MAG: CHAT domain-containing protein [Deltaproteobacteria bacterium]|nr:CHAT domain-containing protein [Deltaproteobacteria bacterium]
MHDRPHARGACALLMIVLGACAADPEPAPGRIEPGPRADVVVPAVVPFDASTRQLLFSEADLDDPETARLARRERELGYALVLPIRPARAGDAADTHRGVALAEVLTHMLAVNGRDAGVERATFMLDTTALAGMSAVLARDDLFGSAEARERFLATPMSDARDLPSGLVKTPVRWVAGGQLLPPSAHARRRVFLWLMDRVEGKVWSGTTDVDVPRLAMPRLLLLGLLTDAGLGPGEAERGDMGWTEEVSGTALVALGRAALAVARGAPDHGALIDAAVAAAPWSFTTWMLHARVHATRERACTPEVRGTLNRALSLNPHADFFAVAEAMHCDISELVVGPSGELFDALARSGTTNCAVAGKAIATIGGGREVPGAGFVAGLGGLYRNTTCTAGDARALTTLAESARDPFVAAGLYIDAGVAAIADNTIDEAEEWFTTAITKVRSMPERGPCLPELYIAEAELHLAGIMLQRGQGGRARSHVAAAQKIGVACHEDRLVARAWNVLGLVEQAAGQYAKALAAFERALARFEALGDDMNRAVLHLNVGWTRVLIGQKDKAYPDLKKALEGKRRVRSTGGVAVALETLGVTLMTEGRFVEAEPLLLEARDLTTDTMSRAAILNSLARIRAGQGKAEDARAFLAEALDLARAAHARTLEAQVMQTKGGVEAELASHGKAFAAFNEALVMRREVGDRAGEGLTLSSLMTVAERMGKPTLAIVYGKLAIAAHQEVQASTRALGKEAELAFLRSRETTYRQLGDLLVRSGRLIEAERVLELLKIDEANDWTRSAEGGGGSAQLTPSEEALARDYQKAADDVMRLGREHGALAAKWPLTADETARLEDLRKRLEGANAAFSNFLASLAERRIEPRGVEELREGTGIGPDLAELEPGTVAVYTLVTDDRLHMIVVSPDTQVAESVQVRGNMLNRLVSELRRTLQDPRSDPKPVARELYDVMVAPIVKHLDGAKATTILWSLDRVLRYVPIGALWDGERWVAERWRSAVFTPASRARLKDKPASQWRVLGAGVSLKTEGFSPLPAVKEELAAIVDDADTREVEGVLPGVVLLDKAFEKNAFLSLLGRKWPVVHIASHFAFEPGNKDASFLVLGQGRLSVAELENMPNLFQGVDLLSLSACNTATGDADGEVGREVESFAVLAQRKGARAVMATLWPVADRSTSALMRRFYTLHRDGGMTKLAALQAAQLELASGALGAGGAGADARGPKPLASANTPKPTAPVADWTHPYYWAPFVLIGNTL